MADTRISIDKFIPLYMKAVEEGITREEFARRIGVKPETVYQRSYELRKRGVDIPVMATQAKVPLIERAKSMVAEYRSGSKPKAKAKKAEAETVTVHEVDAMDAVSDPIAELLG